MNYNDVEYIMKNAKTLQTCPGYSIYRDIPKEIADARKRLWPIYKDTKNANPQSTVRIIYPAKLICGRDTIRDEFPDWHSVMYKSRIPTFPQIDESFGPPHEPAYHAVPATDLPTCPDIPSGGSTSLPSDRAVTSQPQRVIQRNGSSDVLDLSQVNDVPSDNTKTGSPDIVSSQSTPSNSTPGNRSGSHSSRSDTRSNTTGARGRKQSVSLSRGSQSRARVQIDSSRNNNAAGDLPNLPRDSQRSVIDSG